MSGKIFKNNFQCCKCGAENIEQKTLTKNTIFSAASAGLNLRTRRRASNGREGYTAGTTTSGEDDQDHGNNDDKGSCTNYIDHVDNVDYMMMMIMVTLCRANDDGDDDEFHRFLWHGRLASSPFPPSSGIVGRIVE